MEWSELQFLPFPFTWTKSGMQHGSNDYLKVDFIHCEMNHEWEFL